MKALLVKEAREWGAPLAFAALLGGALVPLFLKLISAPHAPRESVERAPAHLRHPLPAT